MALRLLESTPTLVASLPELKTYLRIDHDLDDFFLTHLIKVATQLIEEHTGKSLLIRKWLYTHCNNVLTLPTSPVVDILEVRHNNRVLRKKDYEVRERNSKITITVPFSWKERTFGVTYTAGFGQDADDVPLALRHSVLTAAAYLYENRLESGGPPRTPIFEKVQPWIQCYRKFELH